MAIIKDVTVKINNGSATLDAPVQFYEKDHDVELRFKLLDYKYKYDKDPQNILNSVDEDILEAYTTIVNPIGYELEQINGVVKNDVVIFRLDPTYTDELEELGTYKLQIHIKCTHSEFTIPPITFEVLQRLKGIKVVTDGDDEVDNSEILDNSSKFVSDETGKLLIEWKKGDMISSAKLNAMVDVINDAVDEEKVRQANEIEREKNANDKIQELEDTRVEYINKIDNKLDSVDNQVDASMSDYETRFNALTVSQQQDAEVIDARDGEQTLRARLDRDIQKPSIMYEEVEGSVISCDSTEGYAQNVEILGNTIQNQNDLADIRSVGDKVEGQELYEIPIVSCGKNLNKSQEFGIGINQDGSYNPIGENNVTDYCNVKGNTQYTTSINGVLRVVNQFYYDKDKKFISKSVNPGSTFTTPQGAKYARFTFGLTQESLIQLEEGTQATEYEPYQEDKLTILSPVQLEKVGDIADRIICKDGVWGVEKNIGQYILTRENYKPTTFRENDTAVCVGYNFTPTCVATNSLQNAISTRLVCKNINQVYNSFEVGFAINNSKWLYVAIPKTNIVNISLEGIFDWIFKQPFIVHYELEKPQFIPLPHDQQIKLRTFAGKTNIHFETEIEPTLKASIPKSIGATVNTHTEQISNLNKELDRVKKLEESTVSTVTTEIGNINTEIGNINTDLTRLTESIEGSSVSVDSKDGYLKDVEILGNTIQDQNNLADIRSVGDKIEGQELYEIPVVSCGKNIYSGATNTGYINANGSVGENPTWILSDKIKVYPNKDYIFLDSKNVLGLGVSAIYDKNGNLLKRFSSTNNFSTYEYTDVEYALVSFRKPDSSAMTEFELETKIQIEYGTQPTPYEPYQEDKLTILSPVQLEKVGGVADRIICKDGVWGVEKNIYTELINGQYNFQKGYTSSNTAIYQRLFTNLKAVNNNAVCIISDKFLGIKNESWEVDQEAVFLNSGGYVQFRISHASIGENTFAEYTKENNILIKAQLSEPQFIPLPYDQQIKMRTFANKTNIHFLTEIEPTLKASVPKSIGASVSSNTTEIDNLYDEIDKIKKLEESTVSTVTTESDFTTVEETSNGYFEDVKLEGKTLVNLAKPLNATHYGTNNGGSFLNNEFISVINGNFSGFVQRDISMYKPNTTYTAIVNIKSNTTNIGIYSLSQLGAERSIISKSVLIAEPQQTGICMFKFITRESIDSLRGFNIICNGSYTGQCTINNVIILEGDHTQNPPSYFEGLKSVGQDVEDVSVESANENLFDYTKFSKIQDSDTAVMVNGELEIKRGSGTPVQGGVKYGVYLAANQKYCVQLHARGIMGGHALGIALYNSANVLDISNRVFRDASFNKEGILIKEFTVSNSGTYYLCFNLDGTDKSVWIKDIILSNTTKPYTPHQSDKKQILYYNNETNTWEKPILRQWDSIEKHSDGKYYYHKRSGEICINNIITSNIADEGAVITYRRFRYMFNANILPNSININNKYSAIYTDTQLTGSDDFYVRVAPNIVWIYAKNTDLTIENMVEHFNGLTVVYQLAQEEVYECTNIDLITYTNETNYIVNSGAIVPKTTLKIHQNITNITTILQEKVSILENDTNATNSNTIKIDNLYDEVDKLKKLEEGPTSTVTTESDFTTVEETNNGYFEDVKLEGKTLVNLVNKPITIYSTVNNGNSKSVIGNNSFECTIVDKDAITFFIFGLSKSIAFNKQYTLIYSIDENSINSRESTYGLYIDGIYGSFNSKTVSGGKLDGKLGIYYVLLKSPTEPLNSTSSDMSKLSLAIHNSIVDGKLKVSNIILLEGDHTQNPPEFFEGIKSVGQDVDEISVLSESRNLLNRADLTEGYFMNSSNIVGVNTKYYISDYIELSKGEYVFSGFTRSGTHSIESGNAYPSNIVVSLYNSKKEYMTFLTLRVIDGNSILNITHDDVSYIRTSVGLEDYLTANIQHVDSFITQKQDKKPILYYNNETQTWEKPVLRQWDSIEKHSDGKYYYHKRSGEVVINGSENWALAGRQFTNTMEFFKMSINTDGCKGSNYIADKFVYNRTAYSNNEDIECITNNSVIETEIVIIQINKSKLSTQDVKGFTQWLQANPTTVVYQLAEEKVYECTDLDLITYQNETNLLISSGALNPKVSLKVSKGVGNTVKMLQNKVRMLEQTVYNLMKMLITQQSNIDE